MQVATFGIFQAWFIVFICLLSKLTDTYAKFNQPIVNVFWG